MHISVGLFRLRVPTKVTSKQISQANYFYRQGYHRSRTGVPKLPLAIYPFSISVDEHVPLNMGAGRIFSRQGPKVEFPGAVV